jgi:hypothetical protein
LVLVMSSVENSDVRDVIRATWGAKERSYQHGSRVQTLFVVGRGKADEKIHLESKQYGDLIQVPVLDTYHNLVHKSSAMFKWVLRYCAHAQYILKADDDTFNHIRNHVDYLQNYGSEVFVGGNCPTDATPHRSNNSKYYDPTFQGETYPAFCYGPTYVLSREALRRIIAVSESVSLISLEDVFITGRCREAAGVPYVQIPGMFGHFMIASPCNLRDHIKSIHLSSSDENRSLWNFINSPMMKHVKCNGDMRDELILYVSVVSFVLLGLAVGMLMKKKISKRRLPTNIRTILQ